MLYYQASPFTGEIIPVYRTKHPPLQEKTSPFPGGIIPVSRRERETTSPFTGDCDKVRIFKVLYHHFPPCEQTIIPVSRRNHPRFQDHRKNTCRCGNIPVSRMGAWA